ncbi:MAG TPA: CpcT/CpeT family chromophore lyase [Steroidobacteraceae bacterium]
MFNWFDRRLTIPGARRALAIGAVAASFALAGCASQQHNQEQQLKLLVAALPGEYDNNAQVQADARASVQPAHTPLALTVYKFKNGLVGENVLYVAERATTEGRRLVFQQVWALAMDGTGKIVQVVYRFRDPQRWRNIMQNPELFEALQFEDLQPMGGCQVIWKIAPRGFAGENSRGSCRRRDGDSEQSDVVWQRLEQHGAELAIAELHYDASGQPVPGVASDPFNRFLRIDSGAP